jgi:hypothetical protein
MKLLDHVGQFALLSLAILAGLVCFSPNIANAMDSYGREANLFFPSQPNMTNPGDIDFGDIKTPITPDLTPGIDLELRDVQVHWVNTPDAHHAAAENTWRLTFNAWANSHSHHEIVFYQMLGGQETEIDRYEALFSSGSGATNSVDLPLNGFNYRYGDLKMVLSEKTSDPENQSIILDRPLDGGDLVIRRVDTGPIAVGATSRHISFDITNYGPITSYRAWVRLRADSGREWWKQVLPLSLGASQSFDIEYGQELAGERYRLQLFPWSADPLNSEYSADVGRYGNIYGSRSTL